MIIALREKCHTGREKIESTFFGPLQFRCNYYHNAQEQQDRMKKPEFGYAPGGIAIWKGRRDRLYDPITKSTSSFVLNAS